MKSSIEVSTGSFQGHCEFRENRGSDGRTLRKGVNKFLAVIFILRDGFT
jgi:hypothetical protein